MSAEWSLSGTQSEHAPNHRSRPAEVLSPAASHVKESARLSINILVHTGVFDGLPKIAVYLVGLEPWVKDVQVRPAPL